jgi:hypothetical protein
MSIAENRDFSTVVVKAYDVELKTKYISPDTKYHTDARTCSPPEAFYLFYREA